MQKLTIKLENCYGIKKLETEFDFSKHPAYAIYAPNGSMKSSLAKTFEDVAKATVSKDRIFPTRTCSREITDENGVDLPKESVFVIQPYDATFGHTEKTSTLLVNSELRKEYEELHLEIDNSKKMFLTALKEQSGSKKNLENEISFAFTQRDDQFIIALSRVKDEVRAQKDSPFADIKYDTIFDEKVLDFLGTKDVKTAIESFVKKYNQLLAASTYFKKGTFNYYNAANIAKNLAENGFFDAKHTVYLNADEKLEITSQKELEDLIAKEKEGISKDMELRKKFAAIDKLIKKNAKLRNFEAYLVEHEELLPHLVNIDSFKQEIWKSYFKKHIDLYNDLIEKYLKAENRKKEIEEEARTQRTQWHKVIEIFNSRFFVPFELIAENMLDVMLRDEPMLRLGFTFKDGEDTASVEKNALMQVLSTGERKALYILNIIFEVEAREKANQETIFIFDDIADSFDYKNKYAIIQYMQDIAEISHFKQIIMTHNFDFLGTINSRFVVKYHHCLMALKSDGGISLEQAIGIKNVFVNDWKLNFFKDPKKRIASITFIRNIIEYTKGGKDSDYIKLTSLLHWKSDSDSITQDDLYDIYKSTFGGNESSDDGTSSVMDIIDYEAKKCLSAGDGINFENKIVLSIAIRIAAEQFMVKKINDTIFVDSIKSRQTTKLFAKFRELFSGETDQIETIKRVILMTPESIHLNSFMYEPIIDMSDKHLKQLYKEIKAL